jgi:hypothetical protein
MTNSELPPDVIASDLVYPKFSMRPKKADKIDYALGEHGSLKFHLTEGFGWVIATLPISSARRADVPDRTYGIRISDGSSVRVGAGPHVTRTITVYLKAGRLKVLQKYLDLYMTGMGKANTIRDRISSRRAQGVEMRAAGRHSWRWSV